MWLCKIKVEGAQSSRRRAARLTGLLQPRLASSTFNRRGLPTATSATVDTKYGRRNSEGAFLAQSFGFRDPAVKFSALNSSKQLLAQILK
ncbi:hypothetical protein JMJ77_0015141 [Colletotrichum scovillei]|uniref:Uncharacterized protein n=1 Tax=Colletotrichum scovillei TaxID=1209932 RepID=A0A9P7R3K2_9PEZI|nr:hypothetical protein JMJ77_0015141 [Colletotrichum scovillei]KAG7056762.1 hypothetical protein JMJ78_0000552 [Colletotrichum scovillei]KAG7066689.1 hypothetical protein JMJ76_0000543 [Colletotrichum scovillei]